MSKTAKIVLIAVGSSVLLICGLIIGGVYLLNFVFFTNDRDNNDPQKQQEMLECTLEWGRLAPIPDSKTGFQIKTEGSMFTRAFRSSFYLPQEDLSNWIKASPGLQGFEAQTSGTKKYNIEPGGEAAYAEATIDFDTGFVEIYTCWS